MALRLIAVLPEESVTVAMMRADPDRPRAKATSSRPRDSWRSWHGWTRTNDQLADLYDLLPALRSGKKVKPLAARPGRR